MSIFDKQKVIYIYVWYTNMIKWNSLKRNNVSIKREIVFEKNELLFQKNKIKKIVYFEIYVMGEDCLSCLTCVLSFCLFEQWNMFKVK